MKQTVKTSRAAGQLEKMFRELNKHCFAGKLPEPIISLKKTPSAYGHITCSKVWQAGGENKYEINISSATLDRPIEETASTLLHEMVHEYCMETGIKDTSNNGVYHNRRFKEQAARHPAAVRPERPSLPKQRAAPGGGYAPSAEPSSGAPRKCGSSVRTAWSFS